MDTSEGVFLFAKLSILMALQTSGRINFSDIKGEFGGTDPIRFSRYYKGGSFVPNITNNAKVPTSGQVKLSDYYGAVQFVPKMYELVLNVSMNIDGSDYFWFGWYNTGDPSAPYAQVTHRNFQNAWAMSTNWSLTEKSCTNLSVPLRSSSYTVTNSTTNGTVSLGYSNAKLPFDIPKFVYTAYVAPDPTLGFLFEANKVIIQLEDTEGRPAKTFYQTQDNTNNYTTIVLVNDDGYGSWTPAKFRLTYRWVVLAP